MRHVKNEKGIALVLALLLSLISLAILSALIYFITQGTEMSGFLKRYRTAGEAAKGGLQLTTNEFIPYLISGGSTSSLSSLYNSGSSSLPYPLALAFPSSSSTNCFNIKLQNPTASWVAAGCPNDPNLNNPDPTVGAADATFNLQAYGPSQPFQVSLRIVDTVLGNTDTSGLDLEGLGVVDSGSGMVSPAPQPYLYRIEATSQRLNNPDEKASFSAIYAY